jgi:ketosteroid isomerase-like protein
MKNQILLIIISALTLMSYKYSNGQLSKLQGNDPELARKTLLKADRDWARAASTGDLKLAWSFWSEDALILVTPDYTVTGKQQIKEFTSRNRKDPNFQIGWEPTDAMVSKSGDMGYTYGIGSVTRTDEKGKPITVTKPYLVVWEKDDEGKWKCVIEN